MKSVQKKLMKVSYPNSSNNRKEKVIIIIALTETIAKSDTTRQIKTTHFLCFDHTIEGEENYTINVQ